MTVDFLIRKRITLANEYVTGSHRHAISKTNGQAKVKFSKKEFLQIFGDNKVGEVIYNKNNIINFLNLMKERWQKIIKEKDNDFKQIDLVKIDDIIAKFHEKFGNCSVELIHEEYEFTDYSKKRYALETWIFSDIVYYIAVPFETYMEVIKDNKNNIYLSFGIDYSLIKNSILFKLENSKKEQEKKQEVKIRNGQNKLRETLLENIKKCQITELETADLLITSHIKPWISCSTEQKTDINNVLLLDATFDKLFDRGLMSFSDQGKIIFSDILAPQDLFKLKKIIMHKTLKFNKNQIKYIEYHREKVFRFINGFTSLI